MQAATSIESAGSAAHYRLVVIVWSSLSQMVGKAVPGPSAEALCSKKRQGINVNPFKGDSHNCAVLYSLAFVSQMVGKAVIGLEIVKSKTKSNQVNCNIPYVASRNSQKNTIFSF